MFPWKKGFSEITTSDLKLGKISEEKSYRIKYTLENIPEKVFWI